MQQYVFSHHRHDEKSCPQKPPYLSTRFLVQLMCNYATFVPRKYGAFKNKMSHKKFTSYMIVTYYLQAGSYTISICLVYMMLSMHVGFVDKCMEVIKNIYLTIIVRPKHV